MNAIRYALLLVVFSVLGCVSVLSKKTNIFDIHVAGLVGDHREPAHRISERIRPLLEKHGFSDSTGWVSETKLYFLYTKPEGVGPSEVQDCIISCEALSQASELIVRLGERSQDGSGSKFFSSLTEAIVAELQRSFPELRISVEKEVLREPLFTP